MRRLETARAEGFTLIEVLVVVAILALLVSILLPSLARARAQSRASVCMSNTHQIGVAMNLFTAEYKGRVPRGISRNDGSSPIMLKDPVNWVRMVVRLFGDKNNYELNFNRVPVEKHEVFSCPERHPEEGGIWLDYVVNSTDHRGPLNASGKPFSSPPVTSGMWYEVEGVTKVEVWKLPAETLYATERLEESVEAACNISDPNNSWGTFRSLRKNIATIRQPVPPTQTGFDWFDMAGGRSLPTYPAFLDDNHKPRAALKAHLDRGSNVVFVDGHAARLQPPAQSAGEQRIREFYLRKMGVDRRLVPGNTVLTTTADISMTAGDVNWRPGQ